MRHTRRKGPPRVPIMAALGLYLQNFSVPKIYSLLAFAGYRKAPGRLPRGLFFISVHLSCPVLQGKHTRNCLPGYAVRPFHFCAGRASSTGHSIRLLLCLNKRNHRSILLARPLRATFLIAVFAYFFLLLACLISTGAAGPRYTPRGAAFRLL